MLASLDHAFLDHFHQLGRYNRWANRLLYDAVGTLDDAAYRSDRGAFFKSLHGTLNHLLVTDRVWLSRFTGRDGAPDRLDAILHDDFASLRTAREAEDARIVEYVDRLDDEALAGTVRYRRVSTPDLQEEPLAACLAHWFNHQTHHRGQAHAIISGLGRRPPELDLLFYQREASKLR